MFSCVFTQIKAITGAVEFYDEIKALKKETKKLRANGVNIIIGLGHSGIEMDKKVARQVEDIDLIVGGHSHTFLYSGKPLSFINRRNFSKVNTIYRYLLFINRSISDLHP